MRNWKIIMMVLCLALCLPGLFLQVGTNILS